MARIVHFPGAETHGQLLQLHIELAWIEPAIWRRVVVPDNIRLDKLHAVIQAAMGWTNSHLHEFEIGGQRYGTPDPDWGFGNAALPESRATLAGSLAGKKTFRYTYDFGDSWEHRIKVEKILPEDMHPRVPLCLKGENACPPEDVGGAPGYIEFLEVIFDSHHSEHEGMLEWCGGSFDPNSFDLGQTNKRLQHIKLPSKR